MLMQNPIVTAQDVVTYREGLGLTPEQFSEKFNVPIATLKAWEDGSETFDPTKIDLLYTPD